MSKVETCVPFCGFYCSVYDAAITNDMECRVENEYSVGTDAYAELSDNYDYDSARETISHDHIDCFNAVFQSNFGIPLNLLYKDLDSPKQYNFTTDRLVAEIDAEKVKELRLAADNNKLAETIKKRFTSYDGFISHYSNRIAEWDKIDLSLWDHNMIETLIMSFGDIEDDVIHAVLSDLAL